MKHKAIDIDAMVAEAVPPRPNPQLAFTMPVKLVSEANEREHWRTKHGRKKKQQEDTHKAWKAQRRVHALNSWGHGLLVGVDIAFPCVVRLTRVGPRRLDSDNLAGSFKHVQDAIAKEIGIDDGDERIKWEYAQVPVGKRVYQVRVEVY